MRVPPQQLGRADVDAVEGVRGNRGLREGDVTELLERAGERHAHDPVIDREVEDDVPGLGIASDDLRLRQEVIRPGRPDPGSRGDERQDQEQRSGGQRKPGQGPRHYGCGQPCQPVERPGDEDGERGGAELDVPRVPDRISHRDGQQEGGRRQQPRHGDGRRAEDHPAPRDREFRDRPGDDQGRDRAGPPDGSDAVVDVHHEVGPPRLLRWQPAQRGPLAVGEDSDRHQDDRPDRRRCQPAEPDATAGAGVAAGIGIAVGAETAAGADAQQGQAVRHDEEQAEEVEQPGQGDRDPVGGPPPPRPLSLDRLDEKVGRNGRQHRDDRVGPGLLGVPDGGRRHREDHAGRQAGQIGEGAARGQHQVPGDESNERTGNGHRYHGRNPQRRDRGAQARAGQVDQDVVRAVHRIVVGERGQDLAHGAPGDLLGGRLIAPQRRLAKPVAPGRQAGKRGRQRRRPGRSAPPVAQRCVRDGSSASRRRGLGLSSAHVRELYVPARPTQTQR
jgi:hypothetical protein